MSTNSEPQINADAGEQAQATPNRPQALSADHPNLKLAATRLQRLQWIWAALFSGMAVLAWFTVGEVYPLTALPWLAAALLLAVMLQPALLALVALLWALSLVALIPGMAAVFGPDPISEVFSGGAIETVGRAAVRVLLAGVAWNQFLFYRMLYGTERMVGLDSDLPDIPEVVDNRSDALAVASSVLGAAGAAATLLGSALAGVPGGHALIQLAYHSSIFALGLGLGAAFSPTSQRRWALIGALLGILTFLGSLAAGRLVLP